VLPRKDSWGALGLQLADLSCEERSEICRRAPGICQLAAEQLAFARGLRVQLQAPTRTQNKTHVVR
jgi:hypothetical protein